MVGQGAKQSKKKNTAGIQHACKKHCKNYLQILTGCKQRETIEQERLESLQKIWRYQGNISCKDGHNKGHKSKDLTEVEGIKKRWQEYIEELYKRVLMKWVTMMVRSVTQSQTVWNVKSSGPQKASLQTKLVEVTELQLSYFKSQKMMLLEVLHSVCQQIWKIQQQPQD